MPATFRHRHVPGIAAVLILAVFVSAAPAAPKVRVTTHVYKKVGKLEIKADLHRPDDDRVRPVVVWIHGGALIMGNRAGIDRRVKDMLLGAGYAIVSIDYRLAPETKLPEIIKDVEDAFTWLHKNGRKRKVDTSRVAVMGGSAGGYLTLTAGFRAKPRPRVLVSFWGYGDLVGDWYSKPSPHPRHHGIKLSKSDAWKQVSGPPISDSRDRKGNGGAFYQYCRQHGTWPTAVSGGWDPRRDVKKFIPFMPVRNVTKDYPPTLLIHGTKDTDVPHEQSVMMAAQLKQHGVEHRLISIKNGEHGLGGGNRKEIDASYKAALDFVNRHLK